MRERGHLAPARTRSHGYPRAGDARHLVYQLQHPIRRPIDRSWQSAAGGRVGRCSGIYAGWQVVENAAIALGEAANLITIPGRLCENGLPVPLSEDNWAEFTQNLKDAADVMLVAAEARDQEAASDATNNVADACYFCHEAYRDAPPRCTP